MTRSLFLFSAFCGIIRAADTTTTLSLFFPADNQPLVGSIINVDSQATTVGIKCKPDTPSESCGVPPEGATISQGPSSWHWAFSVSNSEAGLFSQDMNCKLDSANDAASCQVTVTQDIQGKTTTQSTTIVKTGYKTAQLPVAITAGAEKLAASPGATPTNSNPASSPRPTSTNAAEPLKRHNAVLAGVAALAGALLML